MINKYFVLSDIHSYFDQMQEALASAGFDINNDNHVIIICGDIFDRGPKSIELYEWLKDLPESRLILVQGNHELLYFSLLEKDYPDKHDFSNGTVRTFCSLAGVDYMDMDPHTIYYKLQMEGKNVTSTEVTLKLKDTWRKVIKAVKKHPATKWLKSDRWVNFYELENMIFVHSFIPLQIKPNKYNDAFKYYPLYNFASEMLEPIPNWRTEASIIAWDDAKWGCPWKQFNDGLFNDEIANGKKLVCGHWHASDFHRKFEGDNSNNLNIFYSDMLIALDACTAASNFCNVLVIDMASRKCYDQNKNYLGDI